MVVCMLTAPVHAQVSYKEMADGLHAVMEADRTVYTRMVVNRLQNEEKVIKATEHFKDDKTLPLPAQMFRFGAEAVAERKAPFSYSLLSLWPVNKQNAAKTTVEKKGLEAVAKDPASRAQAASTTRSARGSFSRQPVEIARIACGNGERNDLGGVIGVDFPDRVLHVGVQRRSRLDGDGNLLRHFDSSAPVIN